MKLLAFTLVLVLVLATSAIAVAANVAVTVPWSRPAITTGIVYLTLTNVGAAPDRLVKVTSPVAGAVELHESTETKRPTGSMSGMSSGSMASATMAMGGVASMHPVAFVPIPAHGSVKLAPGGYHVMLIDLHHPLQAGQAFPIRLYFAHGPPQTALVHVNAN